MSLAVVAYGPLYTDEPSSADGISNIEIAYVGPSVITSVANVRETPYLISSQVIADPSSNVTPSRSVNSHVLLSFDARPVSVAKSATTADPALPSARA